MSTAGQLFAELGRPGPHPVLKGELALVGLPGVVCTPNTGLSLPGVVFGHGWLQPSERYHGLLRHLASWGIVAASPTTQRGPLPSHRLYAADLRTALDVCVGVRLGDGDISVDPARLGLAGHSTGGGAAILAAADDERVKAVATVSAAEVRPSALDAAARCRMPGLHLVGDRDLIAPRAGHGEAIADAWGGPVALRSVPKATHLGITEGRHWSQLLLDGKPERSTQRATKALFTAFFLVHLAGRTEYLPLLTESVRRCPIELRTEPTETLPAKGRKRSAARAR